MLRNEQTSPAELGDQLFSVNNDSIDGDGIVTILPILPSVINGTEKNDKLRGTAVDDTINGLGGDDNLYGEDGNDTLNGGDGNDYLTGGVGVDTFNGGSGIDTVYFSDEIAPVEVDLSKGIAIQIIANGTQIAETLNSIEQITGTDFDDLIIGDDRINTLSGGDGDDTIKGRGGGDRLVGGKGNDTLQGGAGNDTMNGGLGRDSFDGGMGSDLVNFSREEAGIEADLNEGIARLVTVDGIPFTEALVSVERVVGTSFDDTLIGDDQINTLSGADGDDTIYGGDGGDRVVGGADNDTLFGGDGNDYLNGGTGIDLLDGGTGIDTADFRQEESAITADLGQETVTYTTKDGTVVTESIRNIERVIGTDFDDVLRGDTNSNLLNGWLGNDTLIGGAGNDTLNGGLGIDFLDGGEGVDTADFRLEESAIAVDLTQETATYALPDGTIGTETIRDIERVVGTQFDDTLIGDAENNTLRGWYGNDTLIGGDGNDALRSGYGIDSLNGGEGVDTADFQERESGVFVNLLQNSYTTTAENGSLASGSIFNIERVVGTDHADAIAGDTENNQLYGRDGNDILWGGDGDDVLTGGNGDDILRGSFGDDILTGGVGIDLLSGGANADTFVFESLNGSRDAILDFVSGEGDRIQVSAAGFGGDLVQGVLAADQFVLGSAAQTAQQRFIYDQSTGALAFDVDGSGGQMAVQFASLSAGTSLTSNDFVIV